MIFKDFSYSTNYCMSTQVYILLLIFGLNSFNSDINASTLKSVKRSNNYYLSSQQTHHQNSPINGKSEPKKSSSINLEEEDDFFTAQYYPDIFCFDVLPIHSHKIINEEKFIEFYHPELTVPPPKLNSFESFC